KGESVKSKLFRMHLLAALILALTVAAPGSKQNLITASAQGSSPVTVIHDYRHDVSPPVRNIVPGPLPQRPENEKSHLRRVSQHQNEADPVVQDFNFAAAMPSPLL